MSDDREHRAVRHGVDVDDAAKLLAFELKNPRGETPHRLARVESRICRPWLPVAPDEPAAPGGEMSEILDDRAVFTFQVRGGATYAYHAGTYVFRVTKAPSETDIDLLRMAYNSGRKSALPQRRHGEIDADVALIGADAMRYAAELEAKRLAGLRQRIEAAARERLVGPGAISLPEFLAALAEIFGERPESLLGADLLAGRRGGR